MRDFRGAPRRLGLPRVSRGVRARKFANITEAFYERMGFARTGSLVQDIGNGFVMDDFKLMKPLAE